MHLAPPTLDLEPPLGRRFLIPRRQIRLHLDPHVPEWYHRFRRRITGRRQGYEQAFEACTRVQVLEQGGPFRKFRLAGIREEEYRGRSEQGSDW